MNQDSWSQWVEKIQQADEHDLADVEQAFATAAERHLRIIAARLVRDFRLPMQTFYTEALSAVMETFVILMRDVRNPATKVGSFKAVLDYRAKLAVRRMVNTEVGCAPLAGMQAMLRRRDHYYKVRAELLAANPDSTPTEDEVIATANRRSLETRANAADQAALIKPEDLRDPVTLVHIDASPGWDQASHDRSSESRLDPVDRVRLADAVLRATSDADPTTRTVALWCWEPQREHNPPPPPTRTDLIAAFPQLDAKRAGELHRWLLKELPRRILADKFGMVG